MFDISKYLDKFKKISQSRNFLKNSVAETIKEICNIEINPENIDIKSGIARIKEKTIIKSEIFLKKIKILENLIKKTKGKITDIL